MDPTFDEFVLAAATADLSEEPAARADADCLEFRMDLAEDSLDALSAYDGDLPLIATNRAAWEGGEADDENRLEDLAEAARTEAVEAIDVELASVLEGEANGVLEAASANDVRAIVSAHDFEGTPSRPELVRTLTEAGKHGDVAKLAVTAESRADTLTLLSATEQLSRQGDRVATMAMGEVGRHTRAVAPVYGSRIGYAPVDPARATAPGQYDLATLRELVGALGERKREN
ncbi:type I 3-dehydroquinate dehydratase [Saliphagus infecundisoli]|uniref:3-dehydroquinate dehydratase n=1 Tax=Saliphagus infecundisoli TaxID=1849069 RepID=A0ABD5QDG8_9EURY|nr:type I 3-dehydroquinate dehydratase [Saliphagus infecundisoli]